MLLTLKCIYKPKISKLYTSFICIYICILIGSLCCILLIIHFSCFPSSGPVPPGPANWSTIYPLCAGKLQSPINIETKKVKKKSYPALDLSFEKPCGLVTGQIANVGHAPVFNIDNSKGGAKLSGGPLGCDDYELQQFHFHFGCENSRGSEHTINDRHFAAQV